MDHIQKFLRKLTKKQQDTVLDALTAIDTNELETLDIKPLKGKKGWFRCRIGDIRIVFVRIESGTNVVYDIQFRGKAYRKI